MDIGISSFVSASAGTGKTKTLINRLIYLLLNQVKPSKILCLSFTKAASNEIITRINQKLAKLSICDQEILIEELKDLGFQEITTELTNSARTLFAEFVDEVEPLKVQTIHAFCQDLLNKFPGESGVKLGFKLMDEQVIIKKIEEAKHILLNSEEYKQKIKEILQYLSWHIKEFSLDELLKEIISNREKLDHFFRVALNIDLDRKLVDEEGEILKFLEDMPIIKDHLSLLKEGGKSDLNRALNLEKFLSYSEALKAMLISDYFDSFLTKTGTPLKSLLTKNLEQDYPDLHNILLDEQARVYKFYKKYNGIKVQNLTKCFIKLSYYIREIYKELKQNNNLLDYDDLISISSDLLSNSEYADWIRYKLDGGIDHILVDEAQDNSAKQWNIINKITEEFLNSDDRLKSLFIVGDAKQSIFRFQGAAPEVFNAMNEYLPQEVKRIQLNISFRSGRAILRLVDKIFNQKHIKPLVSNIEEHIEHIANKDFEGNVEIWPLVIEPEKKEEIAWQLPSSFIPEEEITADDILATKIVDQIALWLSENKFIQSKNRAINPGDILILTRRRNEFVHKLIRNLRARSIPVAGIDRLKLLEHPAIQDLISLSNFILCPADDLNLAIILKSPMFNLSEDQLMSLCFNRKQTLWEVLQSNEEYQEVCTFIKSLQPDLIHQFYYDLIESKNMREKYLSYFGAEVNDVFDSFLDIVEKFENEQSPSLQLFIQFIENSSLEVQRDLSLNTGQVRIMTVHGSKGLQSPIVILTDTTSLPFNDDQIIWLNEEELLFPGKAKYYSDDIIQTKAINSAHEYAEYLRLLYVALTRAEDEIIITGTSKKDEAPERSWYNIIANIAS